MGQGRKSTGKTNTSKARTRPRIKDLAPKDDKQVKGAGDIAITKLVNTASPKIN